jgi:hypothetical protein
MSQVNFGTVQVTYCSVYVRSGVSSMMHYDLPRFARCRPLDVG